MSDSDGASSSDPQIARVVKRLALRHFWDLRGMQRIERRDELPGYAEPHYRVLNAAKAPQGLFPRIEEIHIKHWHRFGNAVRQLRNAFFAAERYRAKVIRLPPHPFLSGSEAGQFHLRWSTEPPTDALALSGLFFFVRRTLRLYGALHNEARILRTHIRPMFGKLTGTPDPRVAPDDLVLHFRSGDVFQVPCRAPEYGQPPLAFYVGAIKRERPRRVWLVAEDRGNPCIEAVESSLRVEGIDTVYQSASLEEDLRVLLSARRLITSRGTFATTVASLSPRLEKAYIFDSAPTLKRLGVHVVQGSDLHGALERNSLCHNWAAKPEQVAMLLSYPEDAIGFVDYPTTWWRRNLWDSA